MSKVGETTRLEYHKAPSVSLQPASTTPCLSAPLKVTMFSKPVAFLTVGKLKSFVACIYFMERPRKAIFSHLLKSPTDAGMGGEGALGWALGSFHEFLQRT